MRGAGIDWDPEGVDDYSWCPSPRNCLDVVITALNDLGWKPETDEARALYILAKDDTEALFEWGVAAMEPIITEFENENPFARDALILLVSELIKTEDKEKILKFLNDKDPAMIQMGVSLLKATIKK